MRKKPTRVLLLEDNLGDACLIREALAELEELPYGNAWLSPYELCDAETLNEALVLLADIGFDVILADLWTSDSEGIATFQRLKAAAPQTSIIVLTPVEDPALTVRLVQEGAQDVLVKHEVDCTPLGRSIRCAIERNRIATGLRRLSVREELTGLLNFTGFVQLGEPYCRLLGRCASSASCGLVHIANLDTIGDLGGRHEVEWLLVETAEMIRAFIGDADLAAYIGRGRFALLSPDGDAENLSAKLADAALGLRAKAQQRGAAVELQLHHSAVDLGPYNSGSLELLLDQAEDALWENKPVDTACEIAYQSSIPSLIH